MKLKRRLLKIGVPVALIGIVLAGCGQQSQQQSESESTLKKTEKVRQPSTKKTKPKTVKKTTTTPKRNTATLKPANHVAVIKPGNASTQGLPAVDLGYGVVGSIDSGAGQKYMSFKIGRWNMLIHGNDVNEPATTAQDDAQYIVNWTQNHQLPIPAKHGSLKYDDSAGATLTRDGHSIHGSLNYILSHANLV